MERRSYRDDRNDANSTPPRDDRDHGGGYQRSESSRDGDRRPPQENTKRTTTSSGDGEFVNITGLFPSKSGKADTVFVTEDIVSKLRTIRPSDSLGVSVNKSGKMMLWFIKKT